MIFQKKKNFKPIMFTRSVSFKVQNKVLQKKKPTGILNPSVSIIDQNVIRSLLKYLSLS